MSAPYMCQCGHFEEQHGGIQGWCACCTCHGFREETLAPSPPPIDLADLLARLTRIEEKVNRMLDHSQHPMTIIQSPPMPPPGRGFSGGHQQ